MSCFTRRVTSLAISTYAAEGITPPWRKAALGQSSPGTTCGSPNTPTGRTWLQWARPGLVFARRCGGGEYDPGTDRLRLVALVAEASDLPEPVAAALANPAVGSRTIVDAGGYAWNTVRWGDPADPPLLLVHGVTSSSETFWRVGPALAAADHRVIAVDLPGHGLTGGWRGRHRTDQTAEDLAALIRGADLDRADLPVLGHSWGAVTVAALPRAGFRPGRLILLDPPALTHAVARELMNDPTERRYSDVATASAALRQSGADWSDGDIRAKAIALTQFEEDAARTIYLGNAWDAGLSALSDPAAEDVPAWIIRGEPAHGGLIPDEKFSALTDRVGSDHVVTISGGPHSPQRTHPEATTLAILRALGA